MTLDILYWEFCSLTNLTNHYFNIIVIIFLLTSIANNLLIFLYSLYPITTLMKTSAAWITVYNFVFLLISSWKTYFAVSFKKLVIFFCSIFGFICIKVSLILFDTIDCLVILSQSFINITLSKIKKRLIFFKSFLYLNHLIIHIS